MLPQVFRPGAAAVRARWVRRQEWTSWVAGDPQTHGRATLDTHTMLQHLCSDWKDAQRGGTPLADTTTAPASRFRSASGVPVLYPLTTTGTTLGGPEIDPRRCVSTAHLLLVRPDDALYMLWSAPDQKWTTPGGYVNAELDDAPLPNEPSIGPPVDMVLLSAAFREFEESTSGGFWGVTEVPPLRLGMSKHTHYHRTTHQVRATTTFVASIDTNVTRPLDVPL